MRVLVLGGTGPTGLVTIDALLAASHEVVVYARSPQKLPEHITTGSRVTVVKGELMDSITLAQALAGVHAVVSALGPAARQPPGAPLAQAYTLLLSLMREHGISRIIAASTASVVDARDKLSFPYWLMVTVVAILARNAYKDVVAVGKAFRADENRDIDWTLARVPILKNGTEKGYVVGYIGDGKIKASMNRVCFGVFVVDELERSEWKQKAPVLSEA